MDNKKRNIIILIILCVLLFTIGVFVFVDIFSRDNHDNLLIDNKDKDVISNKDMNDIYDNSIVDEEKNDIIDSEYINDELNNADDNYLDGKIDVDSQKNYNEEDVVSYFESMEEEIGNSSAFKEKFKEYFITIIDFIFYDDEIKGYTFSELTGTARAKIIAIALKIDSKIEDYLPGYKENISSTTGKEYTDIKEKLVISYMDISTAICKDNENECDKVKDIFSDVKDYCKIGWDFIKGLFKSGVTKIKDWYEIYSGK